MAGLHTALGMLDKAIEWLKRGYKERDPALGLAKVEAWFDPLRQDARFQNLMRRMKFPE